MFILVSMAELTAIGIYIPYWWPEIPTWAWAALFSVLTNLINLVNVQLYGETKFWFAVIKVVAIVGMNLFDTWYLAAGLRQRRPAGPLRQPVAAGRLHAARHFGPGMAVIMFSFGE